LRGHKSWQIKGKKLKAKSKAHRPVWQACRPFVLATGITEDTDKISQDSIFCGRNKRPRKTVKY
jgi:hypothetical protein